MSRHKPRQELAREFGATEIVEERGDDGVAKIKELTSGLGAHSVVEAVGTQESMQAIRSTRPGGYVGYVGLSHGVELSGQGMFFSHVHLPGGPAPVRRFLPPVARSDLEPRDRPEQGLRPRTAPRPGCRRLPGHGPTASDQGASSPMI